MSLAYILRRVESIQGISSPNENPAQKLMLIDYVNQAAQEIYESEDLPVILQEVYTNVTRDFRISLPAFVGELRAARNRHFDGLYTLSNIRARYSVEDWPEKWNKWRVIGESAIANDVTNAAPLRYLYEGADTGFNIVTLGVTNSSNRATENVTINAGLVNGTKSFVEITRITKDKVTDCNVVIQDANGNELAIIYADQFESRYMLVDVSMYPNIQCCDNNYVMECLYKPRLPKFANDGDEFPVMGWDDVIVLRTIQLLTENQEGKEDRAILMNQKSKELIRQKTFDKTGTVNARITTKRNGLYNMFPKYYNPDRSNNWWRSGNAN